MKNVTERYKLFLSYQVRHVYTKLFDLQFCEIQMLFASRLTACSDVSFQAHAAFDILHDINFTARTESLSSEVRHIMTA